MRLALSARAGLSLLRVGTGLNWSCRFVVVNVGRKSIIIEENLL